MLLSPGRWLSWIGLTLSLSIMLVGCGSQTPSLPEMSSTPGPAPTIAPMFIVQPTLTPKPATADLSATGFVGNGGDSNRNATEWQKEYTVYDEKLSPDWTVEHSFALEYTLQSRTFVDQGRFALQAVPKEDLAVLQFTLEKDAGTILRRDKVLGLHFRLSGGQDVIANDAISVAILGSNQYQYWVSNDKSVRVEGRVNGDWPLFSETRLYYLDVHKSIPPGEWVDVYVWLDNLVYDPVYAYVTGFYLKSEGLKRYYVDDVSLLLLR